MRVLPVSLIALAAAATAAAVPARPAAASSGPLLVVRAGDIVRLDPHGGGERRLTRTDARENLPRWSPDRRRIAFVSDAAGSPDIWIMRADGSRRRRLTRGPGREWFPTWSPDGRRIAYSASREGREDEIYVRRVRGGRPRRLTRTPKHVMDVHPHFSPDGRRILFSANRPSFFNLELYTMSARTGRNVERLTFWGAGGDGDPGDDAMPEFSPDGQQITFVSDRSGSNEVWIMRADGSDLRRLTDHPSRDTFLPRWSQDGSAIAYLTVTGRGVGHVWSVAADGSAPPRLIGRGEEPDW